MRDKAHIWWDEDSGFWICEYFDRSVRKVMRFRHTTWAHAMDTFDHIRRMYA